MSTILTLRLDDSSQAFFEGMRQQHFPPAKNVIPAHLSLFHQLDGLDVVGPTLENRASFVNIFSIKVTGLRSLGRGVAFVLSSPELLALQKELREEFVDRLTPQDRQKFMPHIVIQNKAAAEEARALLLRLQREFEPRVVQARGLDLWQYLGGPWEHLETFWFREAG